MRRAAPRPGGFTLLEVMVALGLLAAALMALADLSGNALRNVGYARDLTLATLLARGKMAELEEQYEDSGFKDFDEKTDGTFEEQGHPEFGWRAEVVKPDSHLAPEQVFAFLTGSSGGDADDLLAKLFGAGAAGAAGQASGAQGLMPAPVSAMLKTQLTAFGEQVKNAVREVRLTVAWRDGRQTHEFTVVTHFVVLNPRAPGGARGDSPDAPPGAVQAALQQAAQQQAIQGLQQQQGQTRRRRRGGGTGGGTGGTPP